MRVPQEKFGVRAGAMIQSLTLRAEGHSVASG